MANAEEEDGCEDGEQATSTTRSYVCEQQRLRVPATADAGQKLKDFHDQMVELSKFEQDGTHQIFSATVLFLA